LDVTVASDGTFTDTQNPTPPTPDTVPKCTLWKPANDPWKTSTYYTYSYYDEKSKTEGPQSSSSLKVQNNQNVVPMIYCSYNSMYTIKVYRSLTGEDNSFNQLAVTYFDLPGAFTDTQNPTPPIPTTAPSFHGWSPQYR
jgi:hypothetical protein